MNTIPRQKRTFRFRRDWQRRELAALGLLALLPLLARWFSWVFAVEIALLALGGAFVIVILRGNWSLVGPHFYYDIVRFARRGRTTQIRVLYVTGLLVALAFVYSEHFGLRGQFLEMLFDPGIRVSRNSMALLAERYVGAILILQNLAVLLLTPAYVATAITEERERRTLELLFTSHLLDREIVLGKLMARIVVLGCVLLGGLPILSLAQLFGAVDMPVLLANFAITALNLLTVGAVCISTSAMSKSAVSAVIASYGVLLPFAICFSCVTAVITRSGPGLLSQREFGADYVFLLETVGAFAVVQCLIAGVCLSTAIHQVRADPDVDPTMSEPITLAELRQEIFEKRASECGLEPEERIILREGRRGIRRVQGDPLLWKEVVVGGPLLSAIFWLPVASLLFPFVMIFLAALMSGRDSETEVLRNLAMTLTIAVAGLCCLGAGFRTSTGIARERQLGTLDTLLMLPVDDSEILKAKLIGALLRGRIWAGFYLFIVVLAMLGGAFHVVGGVLLIAALFVHALFSAALGLFLSVISRTVLIAQMRLALVLLLLLILNGFVAASFEAIYLPELARFTLCLNPPACWVTLCTSLGDPQHLAPDYAGLLVMVCLSLAVYLAASYGLWRLSCRFFAAEKYRQSSK